MEQFNKDYKRAVAAYNLDTDDGDAEAKKILAGMKRSVPKVFAKDDEKLGLVPRMIDGITNPDIKRKDRNVLLERLRVAIEQQEASTEEEEEERPAAKRRARKSASSEESDTEETSEESSEVEGIERKVEETKFDSPYGDEELIYLFARFNNVVSKGAISNDKNQIALKDLLGESPLVLRGENSQNPFNQWIKKDKILDVHLKGIRARFVNLLRAVRNSAATQDYSVAGNLTAGSNRLETYSQKEKDLMSLFFSEDDRNIESLSLAQKKKFRAADPIVLLFTRPPTKKSLIGKRNENENDIFDVTDSMSEIEAERHKVAKKVYRSLLIACYRGVEEKQLDAYTKLSEAVKIHQYVRLPEGTGKDVKYGAPYQAKLGGRYLGVKGGVPDEVLQREGSSKFSLIVGDDALDVMKFRKNSLRRNMIEYTRVRNFRVPNLFSVYFGTPGFIKWVNTETYGLKGSENTAGFFTVWKSNDKDKKKGGDLVPFRQREFWDYFAELTESEMKKYYPKTSTTGRKKYSEGTYDKLVAYVSNRAHPRVVEGKIVEDEPSAKEILAGIGLPEPQTLVQSGLVLDAAKMGIPNLTLRSFSFLNKKQHLDFTVGDEYGTVIAKVARKTKGGGPIFFFAASDSLKTVLKARSDVDFVFDAGVWKTVDNDRNKTLEAVIQKKITESEATRTSNRNNPFSAKEFLGSDLMTILAALSYKKVDAKYPAWVKGANVTTTKGSERLGDDTSLTYFDLRTALKAERVVLAKAKALSSVGKDKYRANIAKNEATAKRKANAPEDLKKDEETAALMKEFAKRLNMDKKVTGKK